MGTEKRVPGRGGGVSENTAAAAVRPPSPEVRAVASARGLSGNEPRRVKGPDQPALWTGVWTSWGDGGVLLCTTGKGAGDFMGITGLAGRLAAELLSTGCG